MRRPDHREAFRALGSGLRRLDSVPLMGVTDPATVCEVAVRPALSCTVAPAEVQEAMRMVRDALPRVAPGQ